MEMGERLNLLHEEWDTVECHSYIECVDCSNNDQCTQLILAIQLIEFQNEMCDQFDIVKDYLEEA